MRTWFRRRPHRTAVSVGATVLLVTSMGSVGGAAATASPHAPRKGEARAGPARFATFNASLNRPKRGQLSEDLATRGDSQARAVAEIIQRADPDVLLVNEFDYDSRGKSAKLFAKNYLEVSQHGAPPVHYRYRYSAPSNTGIPSGMDLNNDGKIVNTPGKDGYAEDAYGFGDFPGQYGMVVYSKYPIDRQHARSFRHFRWKDMPSALFPPGWYSRAERNKLRLSSKSHWDLPIRVGRGHGPRSTVHLLASHPTPPGFDGAEDRNGRRNHDEIRFWSDYVTPGQGGYIYDDHGQRGGLGAGRRFVIAGDMNADPVDGDSVEHAARQLLDNPRVNAVGAPTSAGAPEAAARQGEANDRQHGDARTDTADFADALPGGPGNLRTDYVLPSWGLRKAHSGVFWPAAADPLSRLTGEAPFPSSDHRLVWQDLRPR